jgi:hypothetical protein
MEGFRSFQQCCASNKREKEQIKMSIRCGGGGWGFNRSAVIPSSDKCHNGNIVYIAALNICWCLIYIKKYLTSCWALTEHRKPKNFTKPTQYFSEYLYITVRRQSVFTTLFNKRRVVEKTEKQLFGKIVNLALGSSPSQFTSSTRKALEKRQ